MVLGRYFWVSLQKSGLQISLLNHDLSWVNTKAWGNSAIYCMSTGILNLWFVSSHQKSSGQESLGLVPPQ